MARQKEIITAIDLPENFKAQESFGRGFQEVRRQKLRSRMCPKRSKCGLEHADRMRLPAANGKTETQTKFSLMRTKALLLAALRVWELKHRIHE